MSLCVTHTFKPETMERKIVINTCYGGFVPSNEAIELYAKLKGLNINRVFHNNTLTASYYVDGILDYEHEFDLHNIDRDDAYLIEVVETLGEKANGFKLCNLKVVSIPMDVRWEIEEYDGVERVAEKHRTWS